jgi:phosphatidylserine synthase
MSMHIQALFDSGQITLLVIAILMIEAVVFAIYFRRIPGVFAGLAAAGCLVLALRAALLQQTWMSIAFLLSLSLLFHILEVLQWLRHAKHQHQ